MHPIERIRTKVFGLRQAPFAALVGVSQGTVSRWERGLLDPSRGQLATIRQAAKDRDLSLNDSWFFDLEQQRERETA